VKEEEKNVGAKPQHVSSFCWRKLCRYKNSIGLFSRRAYSFLFVLLFRREYIKYLEGKMQRAGDRPGHIHQVKSFF
jgi:hypothetical protein